MVCGCVRYRHNHGRKPHWHHNASYTMISKYSDSSGPKRLAYSVVGIRTLLLDTYLFWHPKHHRSQVQPKERLRPVDTRGRTHAPKVLTQILNHIDAVTYVYVCMFSTIMTITNHRELVDSHHHYPSPISSSLSITDLIIIIHHWSSIIFRIITEPIDRRASNQLLSVDIDYH